MLFFSLNSLLLVCSMHMLNPKSGNLGFKQSLNTFLSGSITKWSFGKPNTHVHRLEHFALTWGGLLYGVRLLQSGSFKIKKRAIILQHVNVRLNSYGLE